MAAIVARVGSGSIIAVSLPALEPEDEPALAAIRSGRFYAWDGTPRSHPAALRVPAAGTPAVAAGRLAKLFTRPTWQNVLLLVAGAILAPGKRTVTAALRILGRDQQNDFPIYHGVLSRAVWSSRAVAGWLLRLLVATFLNADATVVIGIDDTIERRWGAKISARGIYRDPVRSSKGHFVKTSGLRWLSAQLLVHIPWAGRIMGLPFLTVLAPSKRFYADKLRSPKTLLDWARQAALQIHRWLPNRRIVLVGDTASPPSISSAPSEAMSASSPDCASTPIFTPPHHPDGRAPDVRR